MMDILCQDLRLTIVLEPHPIERNQHQVRATLSHGSKQIEECFAVSQTTLLSRKYHVREAVILAMRRIVGEAWKEGLIKDGTFSNAPGELTKLSIDLGPE